MLLGALTTLDIGWYFVEWHRSNNAKLGCVVTFEEVDFGLQA